ncbi:CrcB family protein [Avibacterium endocarditidis]|uniref:CrcB family protein n=1 Tax=Avibacterium endocarditidis TaxID=380674 RepID=UPI003CCC2D46
MIALLWQYPQVSSEWRLFLITGFLGSLTTFSSFSAEVVNDFLTENGYLRWQLLFCILAAVCCLRCLVCYCTVIGNKGLHRA